MSQFGRPSGSSRNAAPRVGVAALLLLVVVLTPATQSLDDAVRVHILPVVNRSGEAQFDAVASTVTDTVSLTLRLLGTYRLSRGEPADATALSILPDAGDERLAALGRLAAELPVENIVFGEVLPGSGPELPRLRLLVYDRLTDSITVTGERQPNTLFDIFAATDELAAEVLSGFSGRRVAFGSIRINPRITGSGEPASYRVLLDGEILGDNLRGVDSILAGSHRLTITARVVGEERVLVDEEITVPEDGAVSVTVSVPAVSGADEQAAIARRREEDRLEQVLEAIQAERRRQESDVALDYYLRADEFSDPTLIREEALINAREQVAYETIRGRRLLAEREWERGVSSHALAAEIGERFDQTSLFNSRAEVQFTLGSWDEITVQRDRKPTAWVPLFMSAWAVNYMLSAALGDGDSGRENAQPGLQAQSVPLIPVLAAAGFTAAWNASDWDWQRRRRDLHRYGETGGLPKGGSEDGSSFLPRTFRPRRWEIVPGLWAGGGGQSITLDTAGISAIDGSGNRVDSEWVTIGNGVGAAPGAFQVAIRWWLSARHAVEGQVRVESALMGGNAGLRIGLYADGADSSDDEIELYPDNPRQNLGVAWLYTRNGRSFLRLGLAHRYSTISSEDREDPVVRDILNQLVGGSSGIASQALGAQLGVGWRFGSPPIRPWEFELRYQLERLWFRTGFLGDNGPYWGHGISLNLARAIPLGRSVAAPDLRVAASPARDGPSGDTPAIDRRGPTAFAIIADPGGTFTFGPRVGLEWRAAPTWHAQLWGRHYIGPGRFGPATSLSAGAFDMLDGAMFLGVGVRRYLPALPWIGGSTPDPVHGTSGWYAAVEVEYLRVRNFDDSLDDNNDDGHLYLDGSLVIPQIGAGFRVPIWRSASLDLGVTVGVATGTGIDTVRTNDTSDGSVVVEDTTQRGVLWNNLTVAVAMPIF